MATQSSAPNPEVEFNGRPPTLKDIASASGLSVSTVSLALRGHRRISFQTRQRVIEVAADLRYRPNSLVAAVMRQVRSAHRPAYQGNIAVLNFSCGDRGVSDFTKAALRGAARQAREHGYRLESFSIDVETIGGQRLTGILQTRDIRGILIPPQWDFKGVDRALPGFDWDCFSAVSLTYSLTSPRLHLVCPNHFDNMALVLEKMTRLGYRRIGLYLPSNSDARSHRGWSSAFLRYQWDLPGKWQVPVLITDRLDRGEFLRWCEAKKPEAIVTYRGHVRGWLEDAGRRIPEDIGLAMPNHELPFPDIAGIDQCPGRVGATGCELLVGKITAGFRGIPGFPETRLIPGDWRPGTTLREQASP